MSAQKSDLWRADALRRLEPRLLVIADGDATVNARRAERCGAVRVVGEQHAHYKDRVRLLPLQQALDAGSRAEAAAIPPADRLSELARGVEVSLFLEVPDGTTAAELGLAPRQVRGTQAVVQVTLDELKVLTEEGRAHRAEMGAILRAPDPLDHSADGGEPQPPGSQAIPAHADLHRDGEGVLIGIVDVGGFDFAHPDFLDGEGTRFVRIWDQGGVGTRPAPQAAPFDYGAEFEKEHLDAAIAASPQIHVPPEEIERQSQLTPGSHGTHVASIAAGNLGVCPRAKIAGVLLSLAPEDVERQRSFFDSVRLVHAIEYLFDVARKEECRAVSINISLGTNGHAHDASDPTSRWIDASLVTPGRAVCVAAGNAGQEAPTGPDDIGFVSGRIHTAGTFFAPGETHDIRFHVVGNTIEDVSENELEIWTSNRDRYAVEVVSPSGETWRAAPGEEIDNEQLEDRTFVSVYNRLFHEANGDNLISVYLSPFLGSELVRGIQPGVWTVRLEALDVRDGEFHGWLERDDPRPIVRDGPRELWSFPAFFHTSSNVDERSVSSLGCGERVICVANLDAAQQRVNVSSSQGPTRDGRHKPDFAAPGTAIVAARGFDRERPWTAKTGTSMASPRACGVAGLMLAMRPDLTAAQVAGILQRTAAPLGGGSFDWRDDSGYGALDVAAALDEVARLGHGEVTP